MKVSIYVFLLLLSAISNTFAGKISGVDLHKINNIQFSRTTGLSDYYRFTITPDDLSFVVHLTSSAAVYFYVEELITPTGRKIVTKNPNGVSSELLNHPFVAGRGQFLSPNAELFSVFPGNLSMLVPNNPRVKMEAGEWKVRFAVEKDPQRDLSQSITANAGILLKVRTGAKPLRGRKVSINLYATRSSNMGDRLEAVKAKLNPALDFFKSVGIEIQINNFKQLNDEYDHVSDSFRENDERFQRLLGLWKGAESIHGEYAVRDIDVFFVKRSNYLNGGLAQKTGASLSLFDNEAVNGVLVTTEPGRDSSKIFAHELCHHFGLAHTREDFLSDTQAADHEIYGYQGVQSNLMNLNADSYSLTPLQLEVIYNNPMLIEYN